jgi:hypothetical protein
MTRKLSALLAFICVLTFAPLTAMGGTLYSDNFDINSSANWNINSTSDTAATFAFDYSSLGIVAAPNGGGSTLGLKLEANMSSAIPFTGTEAITLSPLGQYFSGSYQLSFDMWMNYPIGGGGTTEFMAAGGIGYDDTTVNRAGYSGSGGWFAVDGDGGSSRDFRAYKDGQEQFAESGQFLAGTSSAGGGAHNASDPYYSDLGGSTGLGFAWHNVTITVDGGTALWAIDGLSIANLNPGIGNSFPLEGNISIGYMDIFSSTSTGDPTAFGLIDNLVVSSVPEPSTLLLLGSGLAGLGFVRRRLSVRKS